MKKYLKILYNILLSAHDSVLIRVSVDFQKNANKTFLNFLTQIFNKYYLFRPLTKIFAFYIKDSIVK